MAPQSPRLDQQGGSGTSLRSSEIYVLGRMAASQPQRRPRWNARRLVRVAPHARAGVWRCRVEPKAKKRDTSEVPAPTPTPGAGASPVRASLDVRRGG